MPVIKVSEVVVEADAGAQIGHCIRAAALLALEEERCVVLIHNTKRFFIDPGEIIDGISERGGDGGSN